jgi:DinB family protein
MQTELQKFLAQWEHETNGALVLMRALPPDQYDFRPDAGGRSLGELAWHLAEVDAYVSTGIDRKEFKFDVKPQTIERPRTLDAFPPAFRIVHEDAIARIAAGWRGLGSRDSIREWAALEYPKLALAQAADACRSSSRSTDAAMPLSWRRPSSVVRPEARRVSRSRQLAAMILVTGAAGLNGATRQKPERQNALLSQARQSVAKREPPSSPRGQPERYR